MPIEERSISSNRSSFDPTDETVNNVSSTIAEETRRSASYEVRPDEVTTEGLSLLTPERGETVFDTTTNENKYWNGTEWIAILSSDSINESTNLYSQGYIGVLSPFYFGGSATSSEIREEDTDTWMDVVMEVAPVGVSDQRPEDMKLAQSAGFEGTGAAGDPIIFLLEGLVEKSFATLRASLTFIPAEDGGRLDSRLYLERHKFAGPDFTINAAGLAMESGASEEYPHLISTQFFVGDTIDTNAAGDAGKVRFQIKSDVEGTVLINEMALFIQK
tara:strand:+ start:6694 stop:7515 length:822 start_codon:yes stop_codon:yes gene_type:complete